MTLKTRSSLKLVASAAVSALTLAACATSQTTAPAVSSPAIPSSAVAPGAPGAATFWASAAKTGAGSSYEAYVNGRYADGGPTGAVSKVWFSLADGVLTETMYGLIHEAQIKDLRFAMASAGGLSIEGENTTARTEYLHVDAQGRPLSPAYRVTTRDDAGRYEMVKQVFTDPDRNALILRVTFKALGGDMTPYLILEPHMANTGGRDRAEATANALVASEGNVHLALRPSAPFEIASAGFLGASDGLTDLKANGRLTHAYASTGATPGAVVLTGALPTIAAGQTLTRDFVIGFGHSRAEAEGAADASFSTGLDEVLARFNGEGDRVGWEDYVASLDHLPRLAEQAMDGGKLAYASALMLKVQEDRTHAGALIASCPIRGARRWTRPSPRPATRPSGRATSTKWPWPCWRSATPKPRSPPSAICPRSRFAPIRPETPAPPAGSCRRPMWTARSNGWACSSTRRPCRSCWAGSCGRRALSPTRRSPQHGAT